MVTGREREAARDGKCEEGGREEGWKERKEEDLPFYFRPPFLSPGLQLIFFSVRKVERLSTRARAWASVSARRIVAAMQNGHGTGKREREGELNMETQKWCAGEKKKEHTR
jgi:hypothetical protein